MTPHRSRFGALPGEDSVEFTLWAPEARSIELEFTAAGRPTIRVPLTAAADGLWRARIRGATAGGRYRYRAGTGPSWPDPASRSQPDGVHGASAVVDPGAFAWTDGVWRGPCPDALVLYELHVGTFTDAGTFDGVRARLPYLKDLGVTAVELMPVAEWPGRWNWGYDGAALYAPFHGYGTPDDFRRLVDEAHGHGLAVLLDVVYNHLGPDGAYLAAFAPGIFRRDQDSPWGGGLDFRSATDAGAGLRAFCIDNACHWIREYHLDGLRLDATHAIVEPPPATFLTELASAVRAEAPDRQVLVIAEDDRNLSAIVRPATAGGFGLDAVWADDFHHQVHCHLTRERDGYFEDFSGETGDIATTVADGWFYRGAFAPHFGRDRGTTTEGVPRDRFVICLQNHDQVGNRALGERLHHLVALDAFAAAVVVCLLAPETPLLFMGQEWAATSPFQYFTDHVEPLGSQVVAGRRQEFRTFAAFADPAAADRIPSPQAPDTFERSRLRSEERTTSPHDRIHAIHRALLHLRADLRSRGVRLGSIAAAGTGGLGLRFVDPSGQPAALGLVRLSGRGPVCVPVDGADRLKDVTWTPRVSVEAMLHDRPLRADLAWQSDGVTIDCDGPAAVVVVREENARA